MFCLLQVAVSSTVLAADDEDYWPLFPPISDARITVSGCPEPYDYMNGEYYHFADFNNAGAFFRSQATALIRTGVKHVGLPMTIRCPGIGGYIPYLVENPNFW